jgi:hypothetical protein
MTASAILGIQRWALEFVNRIDGILSTEAFHSVIPRSGIPSVHRSTKRPQSTTIALIGKDQSAPIYKDSTRSIDKLQSAPIDRDQSPSIDKLQSARIDKDQSPPIDKDQSPPIDQDQNS